MVEHRKGIEIPSGKSVITLPRNSAPHSVLNANGRSLTGKQADPKARLFDKRNSRAATHATSMKQGRLQ
jgi:hypothetical protein